MADTVGNDASKKDRLKKTRAKPCMGWPGSPRKWGTKRREPKQLRQIQGSRGSRSQGQQPGRHLKADEKGPRKGRKKLFWGCRERYVTMSWKDRGEQPNKKRPILQKRRGRGKF